MQNLGIPDRSRNRTAGGIKFSARHALVTLALALMVFDFRRASGDGGTLPVLITVAALASMTPIFFLKPGLPKLPIMAILPAAIYLVSSIFAGLFESREAYPVIAASIPLVLFITSSIAIASAAFYGGDHDKLLNTIIAFSVASLVWKLFFGFIYHGLSTETVRYQIISGAMPLVFAYGVVAILTGGRRWMTFALLLPLLVVILSITRTYLLVFVMITFAALICMPLSKIKAIAVRTTLLFVLLAGMVSIAYLVIPEFFDRWIDRFSLTSQHGFDLTWSTRMAEAYSQYEQMAASRMRMLFGSGPAAETYYGGVWGQQIFGLLGWDGMGGIGGYGHNFYFGALFVGGVLFGTLFLAMILFWPLAGLRWSKRAIKSEKPHFALLWGSTAAVGYCAYGAFGGLFIDRAMCFYFGIAFGLIFAGKLVAQRQDKSHLAFESQVA